MEEIIVRGGKQLEGTVHIEGAKKCCATNFSCDIIS
jgi:UDP-N-acetylglucosamine enolpyruvyl transferase